MLSVHVKARHPSSWVTLTMPPLGISAGEQPHMGTTSHHLRLSPLQPCSQTFLLPESTSILLFSLSLKEQSLQQWGTDSDPLPALSGCEGKDL